MREEYLTRTVCAMCPTVITHSKCVPRRFCSKQCKSQHRLKTRGGVPLSTGMRGAINELIVSTDLMKKGWHVFRALSPNCVCDLMIVLGSVIKRVEITSGYKSGDVVKYPAHAKSRYDVLAVVLDTGQIHYEGL